MTYQELLNSLAYPVFSADENGLIVYKNRAAVRYIGTMRKGSRVSPHLLGETIPPAGTVAHIKGDDTPYPNALVLAGEEETLFVCFPRLQYPDFEKAAENILRIFGETPASFCETLSEHYRLTEERKRIPRRLSAECLRLRPKPIHADTAPYSIGSMMSDLFSKAETSFSALGYRVHTEILQDFTPNHPVSVGLCDLLFLFGGLLYFMMKLSDDGKLDITLSSDPEQQEHLIRFYTHTSRLSEGDLSAIELFSKISPECASEILFIENQGLIPKNAHFFSDGRGGLSFEYPIPYLDSAFSVRSQTFEKEYASLFSVLLVRVCDMLKEKASSC